MWAIVHLSRFRLVAFYFRPIQLETRFVKNKIGKGFLLRQDYRTQVTSRMHFSRMGTNHSSSRLGGVSAPPSLTRHPDPPTPLGRHPPDLPPPVDKQMPVKTLPSPLRYAMRTVKIVVIFYHNKMSLKIVKVLMQKLKSKLQATTMKIHLNLFTVATCR